MLNLYELLQVPFDADSTAIFAAMKKMAQQQTLTIEQLQLCKNVLGNAANRAKYDAKLKAACPEFFVSEIKAAPETEAPAHQEKAVSEGKKRRWIQCTKTVLNKTGLKVWHVLLIVVKKMGRFINKLFRIRSFRIYVLLPGIFLLLLIIMMLTNSGHQATQTEASVKPASAPIPVQQKYIAKDALKRMTIDEFPDIYERWGGGRVMSAINNMIEPAANLTLQSPQCDEVTKVELDEKQSEVPSKPVFYVDCSHKIFYVSSDDIKNQTVPTPVQPEVLYKGLGRTDEASLKSLCDEAIKLHLKDPDSYDRKWSMDNMETEADGTQDFWFKYSATNSFGAKIQNSGYCRFDTTGNIIALSTGE